MSSLKRGLDQVASTSGNVVKRVRVLPYKRMLRRSTLTQSSPSIMSPTNSALDLAGLENIPGSSSENTVISPVVEKWGEYDSDGFIIPRWWMSPSSLYNYMLKDPLLDWLKGDGIKNSKINRYAVQSDDCFRSFLLNKGNEFEDAVMDYLVQDHGEDNIKQVAFGIDDIRSRAKYEETIELMKAGVPMIQQAVLHNRNNSTYGSADLIVRSDWINKLISEPSISEEDAKIGSPSLGHSDFHYRVIDVKWKTLNLTADGIGLTNSQMTPGNKAQVIVYNTALGKIQGYEPAECYLLGRGYKYTSRGELYSGNNCFDKLGTVSVTGRDKDYLDRIEKALQWKRDVRTSGKNWQVLPIPSRPELYPNMCNKYDFPYSQVKKELAVELNDITMLWNCGTKQRDNAFAGGVRSWKDPLCSTNVMGIYGPKTSVIIQKMLDFNHGNIGKDALVIPKKIKNNWFNWRSKSTKLEFFLDFENFNNVIDTFETFPCRTPVSEFIFMAGLGYINENGKWVYKCFSTNAITHAEERRIFDEMHEYIDQISEEYGVKDPVFYHWGNAEQSLYSNLLDRHPQANWQVPKFGDFLTVMKEEPILVKDVLSFGLKAIGNGMHKHGLINLQWKFNDSCANGQDAMIEAFKCYQEVRGISRRSVQNSRKFRDIIKYNEIDCRMVYAIIKYLRENH